MRNGCTAQPLDLNSQLCFTGAAAVTLDLDLGLDLIGPQGLFSSMPKAKGSMPPSVRTLPSHM